MRAEELDRHAAVDAASSFRLRIALLAGSYVPQRDGISVYIENLLIELLRAAHQHHWQLQVEVFGCGQGLDVLQQVVAENLDVPADGLHFQQLPSAGTWSRYVRLPWQVWRRGSFDLVVLPNLQPLPVPGPRLSILHDLTYQVARPLFSRRRFWYMHALTRMRLRLDAAVGTISQTTHMHLQQFYPRARGMVSPYLPNGLPQTKLASRPERDQIDAAINAERLQIVFCGRLNRLKGVDRLLAFARHLDEQAQDAGLEGVTLHLVGKSTADTAALFAGTRFHDLRIERHGFIDDASLNRLYQDCGFALFLSRNEGFGLPLIEAIWMGAVPLVSDIPIFAEVLGAGYPRFGAGQSANTAMLDLILRLRSDATYRQHILDSLDEVLASHRHGYRACAHNLLAYALREQQQPASGYEDAPRQHAGGKESTQGRL